LLKKSKSGKEKRKTAKYILMWQALIEEILKDERYTEARVAREIGVSPIAIHRIRIGITKEPRYAVGARLMALYLSIEHEKES
jgi:hypothetical protein